MCRRVVRSVFPKMSGPTHPLTQHHLLDSSAIPLSEPQILRQYCLHEYSRRYETGVNFNFYTAVGNDHAYHKACVSNTVPVALHIVIIKPTICDNFSCFYSYGWHSCLQAYRGSIKVCSSSAGGSVRYRLSLKNPSFTINTKLLHNWTWRWNCTISLMKK
jgi:hypothetical protein